VDRRRCFHRVPLFLWPAVAFTQRSFCDLLLKAGCHTLYCWGSSLEVWGGDAGVEFLGRLHSCGRVWQQQNSAPVFYRDQGRSPAGGISCWDVCGSNCPGDQGAERAGAYAPPPFLFWVGVNEGAAVFGWVVINQALGVGVQLVAESHSSFQGQGAEGRGCYCM